MRIHHHITIPCGFLLLVACFFIRYQIGRRRFNRRGVGGLQQFSSYRKAVVTTFLETLILFIGNLCGFAGLYLLALQELITLTFNHYEN
ncbi:hypothetical protein [Mucilaginibacter segetis]|uniref:Uncharacterized protein n=1 Tax=Mucilaginibacter segetis TaxID=2793071 RepID=A0A934PRC9_9SPHI|nr:hypothetical protein [Mucilaginibacter segetis]MBK0379368.1 hypothetical protein [Mucilaginibacter segetis]